METYNPSEKDLRTANHRTAKAVLVRQILQQASFGTTQAEAAQQAEELLRRGIKSLW